MNKNLNVKRNVIYFLSDMKHQFPKFSPYLVSNHHNFIYNHSKTVAIVGTWKDIRHGLMRPLERSVKNTRRLVDDIRRQPNPLVSMVSFFSIHFCL